MNTEPAWKTYLKVLAGLIPTLFFWLFSIFIVFPKILHLWDKAGLGADGHQAPTAALKFFISLSRFAFFNFYYIMALTVVIIAGLELWITPWQRLRKPACTFAAVLLNAFLLLGLTVTLAAALVAGDRLARGQ